MSRRGRLASLHPSAPAAAGFTLMEVLVTMLMVSLLVAIVVPNLGVLVPGARLEGSGKQLQRALDWVRSEARIQARPMSIELDLEQARWRVVYPPEMRLSLDQDPASLEEYDLGWKELEDDVQFAGAGDAKAGMARTGTYRLAFDEYGFSADQLVVLKLKSEPDQLWALELRGLTGTVTTTRIEDGREPRLEPVGEGAF